jgi:hypothetical protein
MERSAGCLLLCARRPLSRPADSRSALAAAGRSLPQVNTIIRCWALLVLQAIKSPNWHRNIKWLACGFACRRGVCRCTACHGRPTSTHPAPIYRGRSVAAARLLPDGRRRHVAPAQTVFFSAWFADRRQALSTSWCPLFCRLLLGNRRKGTCALSLLAHSVLGALATV